MVINLSLQSKEMNGNLQKESWNSCIAVFWELKTLSVLFSFCKLGCIGISCFPDQITNLLRSFLVSSKTKQKQDQQKNKGRCSSIEEIVQFVRLLDYFDARPILTRLNQFKTIGNELELIVRFGLENIMNLIDLLQNLNLERIAGLISNLKDEIEEHIQEFQITFRIDLKSEKCTKCLPCDEFLHLSPQVFWFFFLGFHFFVSFFF
jgi:TATA-box binding protein (TBP) (component of TFIID and TFIIIB)